MEKIQVILKEDVANLGKSGELVAVKPGYGRNFLIPQGLAILATKKNVAQLEHQKRVLAVSADKARKEHEAAAGKLNGVSVEISRPVGEGDKLFGSVNTRDIQEALELKGHKVDRKKIDLKDAIKALGEYTVDVRLARDVTAQVKVVVTKK